MPGQNRWMACWVPEAGRAPDTPAPHQHPHQPRKPHLSHLHQVQPTRTGL